MPVKKNGQGTYEFDFIGLVKLLGFLAAMVWIYFGQINALQVSDAVQNLKIASLEARIVEINNLTKSVDSLIIVLQEKGKN